MTRMPTLERYQIEMLLQFLAWLSLITFSLSLICIPWIVARLPKDYFRAPSQAKRVPQYRASVKKVMLLILRNIVGILLLAAGVAMLFLPGQGLITMIMGLAVMSFPYKQLLLHTVTRPIPVQRSLDWIRKKSNKDSFHW